MKGVEEAGTAAAVALRDRSDSIGGAAATLVLLGKRPYAAGGKDAGDDDTTIGAGGWQQQQQQQETDVPGRRGFGAAGDKAPEHVLLSLTDDLLWRVLAFAGAWASGRASGRAVRAVADARVEGLAIKPMVPAAVLRRLLAKVPNLKALDLSGVAAVDDALAAWVVGTACRSLGRLAVNYCPQLTPAVAPLLFRVPQVSLRGCWRLLRPCPSLPSEAVLELQLLALQQNDCRRHDGVAKHYEFASPANRGVNEEDGSAVGLEAFTAVVYERLSPMLGCQSFSVRQLSYDCPDRACFLVRTTQGVPHFAEAGAAGAGARSGVDAHVTMAQSPPQHYLWLLSRQAEGQLRGCWMTDAIISAEHGLLSFLSLLPLLTGEDNSSSSGAAAAVHAPSSSSSLAGSA